MILIWRSCDNCIRKDDMKVSSILLGGGEKNVHMLPFHQMIIRVIPWSKLTLDLDIADTWIWLLILDVSHSCYPISTQNSNNSLFILLKHKVHGSSISGLKSQESWILEPLIIHIIMLLKFESRNLISLINYTYCADLDVGCRVNSRAVEESHVHGKGVFVGGGSGKLDVVNVHISANVGGECIWSRWRVAIRRSENYVDEVWGFVHFTVPRICCTWHSTVSTWIEVRLELDKRR